MEEFKNSKSEEINIDLEKQEEFSSKERVQEIRTQIKEAEQAEDEEKVLILEQELRNIENVSNEENNNNGEKTETNSEIINDTEKEQVLFSEKLEKLDHNVNTIDSFKAETLAENEDALDELGEKVTGIFSKITEKLSHIETEKLLLSGVLVGIAAAAINAAGLSQFSNYLSYLPDAVQHFISSPDSAGSMLWTVINESGNFTLPSIGNYATQAQHAGEVFASQGEHIENASRVAAAMMNVTTGMVIGFASYGIGNVMKKWAQAKESIKVKLNK